jgi:hypothetical protein
MACKFSGVVLSPSKEQLSSPRTILSKGLYCIEKVVLTPLKIEFYSEMGQIGSFKK